MNTPGQWRASNPAELGKALASARQARGLTQQELANRMYIHRSYLARMEAGLSTEQVTRTLSVLRELGFELLVVERRDG